MDFREEDSTYIQQEVLVRRRFIFSDYNLYSGAQCQTPHQQTADDMSGINLDMKGSISRQYSDCKFQNSPNYNNCKLLWDVSPSFDFTSGNIRPTTFVFQGHLRAVETSLTPSYFTPKDVDYLKSSHQENMSLRHCFESEAGASDSQQCRKDIFVNPPSEETSHFHASCCHDSNALCRCIAHENKSLSGHYEKMNSFDSFDDFRFNSSEMRVDDTFALSNISEHCSTSTNTPMSSCRILSSTPSGIDLPNIGSFLDFLHHGY